MFDIIVVGGGHAGYEAATAACRLQKKTILISSNLDRLGYMSCNPAVGGLAKGQMVKEIDALGGIIGKVADRTGIQFRILKRGRGPAVQATRSQNDRALFAGEVKRVLENDYPLLTMRQGTVIGLLYSGNKVTGIKLNDQSEITGRKIILTCGTFLNGLIHIGLESEPGGRKGDLAVCGLTQSLIDAGISTARLKTGTPPRLDGKTIDYSRMIRQDGDTPTPFFSLESKTTSLSQLPCYLTHTNSETVCIIKDNLDRSPLYSGKIVGIGPRYCPSIEDKIVKFPQHSEHQVFIEPEGVDTSEVYANGIPTSLPKDVQEGIVHSITGLESAVITSYGYAIEYDFFPPVQLYHSLESKVVNSLYIAGQLNGTSGYEEAAGQGLLAGINAALSLDNKEPLILRRDQAYLGVLIDDLVTKGTNEPYRMFTSRAEYRLQLRDDNAVFRLHNIAHTLGLVGEERNNYVNSLQNEATTEMKRLHQERAESKKLKKICFDMKITLKPGDDRLFTLCKRPELGYSRINTLFPPPSAINPHTIRYLESEIKYEGYIDREARLNQKRAGWEQISIPDNFEYDKANGISIEARQKLHKVQPRTLAQASRISGVRPADIEVLLIYLKKHSATGSNLQKQQ